MSKIAVVFDVHAWPHKRHGGALVKGINRRGALCLDVLRRAVDVANANDAPLIVAGDLIDSAGPVQPQFAAALRKKLSRCRNGCQLVLGNHDMTADGDHSLGIYESDDQDYGAVTVRDAIYKVGTGVPWEPSKITGKYCLVPFHRDIRDERVRDVPLLIAHFGVYDDSFSTWCKRSKGVWHVDALFAFMKERSIKCCLLGDWHGRAIWQRRGDVTVHHSNCVKYITELDAADGPIIFQGGALVPTGWDNPGLRDYGTIALWDTDEHHLSWQELPGPRFCVARSDAEETALVGEAAKLDHNLYLRRYYSGDRPATPQGIEAYEALPVAIETAALRTIKTEYGKHPQTGEMLFYPEPKLELERLVNEWLEQFGNDKDALEAHVRKYL